MDDTISSPVFLPLKPATDHNDDAELSSDDEGGPDWTKFKPQSFSNDTAAKPSLPKRGDKEFEPSANGPTNLQSFALQRSRDAMFGALSAERDISNKSISYAIWDPALSRAIPTLSRGVLFTGMGHSVPRPVAVLADNGSMEVKITRRTELLPEEALYLIERGTLFCWMATPGEEMTQVDEGDEHAVRGAPMSVQQAYAEMIGKENLTLDRYHAFAYLKRLGFNIIRSSPPSPSYPSPSPPKVISNTSPPSCLQHAVMQGLKCLWEDLSIIPRFIFKPFTWLLESDIIGGRDWWRPVKFSLIWGCKRDYVSVYRDLRLIPSGHSVPLQPILPATSVSESKSSPASETDSEYKIFYHGYKPSTPFKKSAPPAPDFSLVVVNARTSFLPSLHELTTLWSYVPENPPPLPRQRAQKPTQTPSQPTPLQRTLPWPFSVIASLNPFSSTPPLNQKQGQVKKPHPFALLKNGKKTIVVGAVDCGTVGFFRFGMGAFEEGPVV